jgi:hypothetical protein
MVNIFEGYKAAMVVVDENKRWLECNTNMDS